MEKKIEIYSLTTTYPESVDSKTHQFVHILNKELVKLGYDIKTITPHSKGLPTHEKMDDVKIKHFTSVLTAALIRFTLPIKLLL